MLYWIGYAGYDTSSALRRVHLIKLGNRNSYVGCPAMCSELALNSKAIAVPGEILIALP